MRVISWPKNDEPKKKAMKMGKTSLYLLVQLTLLLHSGQGHDVPPITDDLDALLDWCIDAKYHKSKPGPEDELHAQVGFFFTDLQSMAKVIWWC